MGTLSQTLMCCKHTWRERERRMTYNKDAQQEHLTYTCIPFWNYASLSTDPPGSSNRQCCNWTCWVSLIKLCKLRSNVQRASAILTSRLYSIWEWACTQALFWNILDSINHVPSWFWTFTKKKSHLEYIFQNKTNPQLKKYFQGQPVFTENNLTLLLSSGASRFYCYTALISKINDAGLLLHWNWWDTWIELSNS